MDNEDMALVKKLTSYLREKLEKYGEAVLGSEWDAIPASRGYMIRFSDVLVCVCHYYLDSEVGSWVSLLYES